MPRWAIPRRVVLPFGYRITIVNLDEEDFTEDYGKDVCAAWVVEEKTIYLRAARPIKARRADLAHEMLHCVSDWQEMVLGGVHSDPKA